MAEPAASHPQPPPPAPRREPVAAALALATLAVALSPVFFELVGHWIAEPRVRPSLVFAFLLVLAARRGGPAEPVRSGWGFLGAALALELLALGGGVPKLARWSLPLAVIGLCRGLGLAPLRTAFLAVWLVPVPATVYALASPALEGTWVFLARLPFGGELAVTAGREPSFVVESSTGALLIKARDGGLLLAAFLAGVGWYAGLRRTRRGAGLVVDAAVWGAAGLALQPLIVFAAFALLAGGHPAWGRHVLAHAGVLCVLAGWAAVEARAARSPRRARAGPAPSASARWEQA